MGNSSTERDTKLQTPKAHYDAAVDAARAGQDADAHGEAAQRLRRQGPAYPLKAFHNRIKQAMIKRLCARGSSVLDLCCGRGGDIRKWLAAGVRSVRGLDVSGAAIEEARRRYTSLGDASKSIKCDFDVVETLSTSVWTAARCNRPFDAVTCFFAIQYFFSGDGALHSLLGTVAANLRDGGVFFGTCPDAKRVAKLLGSSKEHATQHVHLARTWHPANSYAAFGSKYLMSIADTVTEGTEATENAEYLAFENVLVTAARMHGLFPMNWPRHAIVDGMLAPCQAPHWAYRAFQPLREEFSGEQDDLFQASSMYVAFAFVKRAHLMPAATKAHTQNA
jgi:mRNA (guanine-N7-)-methyltransferase